MGTAARHGWRAPDVGGAQPLLTFKTLLSHNLCLTGLSNCNPKQGFHMDGGNVQASLGVPGMLGLLKGLELEHSWFPSSSCDWEV